MQMTWGEEALIPSHSPFSVQILFFIYYTMQIYIFFFLFAIFHHRFCLLSRLTEFSSFNCHPLLPGFRSPFPRFSNSFFPDFHPLSPSTSFLYSPVPRLHHQTFLFRPMPPGPDATPGQRSVSRWGDEGVDAGPKGFSGCARSFRLPQARWRMSRSPRLCVRSFVYLFTAVNNKGRSWCYGGRGKGNVETQEG